MINVIKKNMYKHENNLSKYATKDSDYIRFFDEEEDFRSPFFRDVDRIIHSLSYTKYLDKTQVFSFNDNDFISKRMTHVQLVSKIARTIGRALKLNEDLIEAIALGHDIGHTPLGHVGESYLSKISEREGLGKFNHNVQSVRELMFIDNLGKGRNLCLQTLDGILCHNGEFAKKEYFPRKKSKEEFLMDYENSYKLDFDIKTLVPMTLEGCVVRISDMIGYLGRDIEDAINIGVLKEEDLPIEITKVLGKNNKEIVNTIVLDIINNSYDKPYIKLSDHIYDAIVTLKKFNYKNIYALAYTKEELIKFEHMFNKLYDYYLAALKKKDFTNSIYKVFLNNQCKEYRNENLKRIVIDFIAGMTDDYFMIEYSKIGE